MKLADAVQAMRRAFALSAPCSGPELHLGVDDEAVRMIEDAGGKLRVCLFSNGRAYTSATITVEGVRFGAQSSDRPATMADLAALSRAA